MATPPPGSSPPDPSPPDPSPPHLAGLYALAQSLTDNPREAARLVAATYRSLPSDETDRLRLYRQLLTIHDASEGLLSKVEESASPTVGFRERALARHLREVLPFAFATLSPDERVLLVMCRGEQLSCADAAHVLDLEPEHACATLDRLTGHLRAVLIQNARPSERPVVEAELDDATLERAVQQFVTGELATPSRSLATLLAASRQPPSPEATPAEDTEGLRRRMPLPLASLAVALVLILAAGALGYGVTAYLSQPPERDLLILVAGHDVAEAPKLVTIPPDQAEQRLLDALDQRVVLPTIDAATYEGLLIDEVVTGIRSPVFFYRDRQADRPLRVYAFTYGLLEKYPDRLQLGQDVLRLLERADTVATREARGRTLTLWRDRDDIFVAVPPEGTADGAADLAARIGRR